MSGKKICIVGPSKSFLSGISYYTIRLANALSDSNVVSVICINKMLPKFLFPGRKRIGKELTSLEYLPQIDVFDGMDYDSIRSWYRAIDFLKSKEPDIIIMQWWTSSVAHLHIILKIFNDIGLKAKIILEMHEVSDPIEMQNFFLNKYSHITGYILQGNADLMIVHSESDKNLVAERYEIQKELIEVVPHGLYDHYPMIEKGYARKKLDFEDEFLILYFGLIRPYKGVPYLIDAFDALPLEIISKSKLLIVGEMWEGYDEVSNAIKESKNNKKIISKFEYVSDDEVPLYFSACDVVVLPYTRASQSGVAHIAMCFGKPIVVSEVGGLKESMSIYSGTFFIPPKDPEKIANTIVNIYNQKEDRDYQAPDRGWDKIGQRYNGLINSL
ncbi:MAG: glycosyltransferase [Candidatus Peribacteraceae bacterium]|nr:glycosyltransferase [Candidatus Peribacteraceae bacterium]